MIEKNFKLCEDCDSCPVVEVNGERLSIKDDFGGSVVLTRDQVEILFRKLHKE